MSLNTHILDGLGKPCLLGRDGPWADVMIGCNFFCNRLFMQPQSWRRDLNDREQHLSERDSVMLV